MDILLVNQFNNPYIKIEDFESDAGTRQVITFSNYKDSEIDELVYNFISQNITRALDELAKAGDDTYFDYLPAYMEQIAQVILLLGKSKQVDPKTLEYAIKQFNRDLLSAYRREDAWEGDFDTDLTINDNICEWAVDYEDNDLGFEETLE